MSLDTKQRAVTRRELAANLALAGKTHAELCADLSVTARELDAALTVQDPVGTWLLRDYLQQVIREDGGTPLPYTVLTDQARQSAEIWFDLRPVPASRPRSTGSRA